MSIVDDLMEQEMQEQQPSESLDEVGQGFNIQDAIEEMVEESKSEEDVEKDIKANETKLVEDQEADKEREEKQKEEPKEDEEESDKLDEENVQEEEIQEPEEEVPEIKVIEAVDTDGDIVEVPENIVFKKKVDGKEVEVNVKELLDNYSGRTAWDRKYTELGIQRKQLEQKTNEFNTKLNKWAEKVEKGDHVGAFMDLAKAANMNPVEVYKQFKQNMLTIAENYAIMSDEERRNSDLHFENEYLENERRSERQAFEEQHALEALQLKVSSFQDTHNLSDEALADLRDQCLEKGLINEEQLLNIRDHGAEVLNTIEKYIVLNKQCDQTEEIINSIDSSLLNNEVVYDIVLAQVRRNKSPEAIKREIKAHYGIKNSTDRKKVLSKKKVVSAKKQLNSVAEAPEEEVNKATDDFFADRFM